MKKRIFLLFTILLVMATATANGESGNIEFEESEALTAENIKDELPSYEEISEEEIEDIIIEKEFDEETIDEEKIIDDLDLLIDSENKTPQYTQPRSQVSLTTPEFLARPEVEEMRNDYLTPKRTELLYKILENAMEYRLYVRKVISDRGLPAELEYLPVVESGYRSTAKSRSGALGLWQFMENSVKPFLTLNEYVDERLDPWKSTEAGLSKLEDNFRFFGDWLLAIGAYNCGAGAMSKAIKKAGSNDFWYLAENGFLPRQTSEYVPKLIAIADLAENAEKYGIDLPSHNEEYELLVNERDAVFDYIEVNESYSIAAIAREMRIDEATLKRLNPSLTKGFTPPSAKFKIRVPSGMLDSAKNAIDAIKPIVFPFKYTVVAGDSLWTISRRFGVTVKALCDTNGIEENAILKIGKILYIPNK